MAVRIEEKGPISPFHIHDDVKNEPISTLERVQRSREAGKKSRLYPTSHSNPPVQVAIHNQEKPTLDPTPPTTRASLHSIILKREQFSQSEKEEATALLKKLEEEEICRRRELTRADHALQATTSTHETSKQWAGILETGQIAAAVGTGIALLKGFATSIGIFMPTPVTALAGFALIITGSAAAAGKLISSSSHKSSASEATGNICGKVALLGSGYAYSQMQPEDRPAILDIAIVFFSITHAAAEAVRSIGAKKLQERKADWQGLNTLMNQLKWQRENTTDNMEEWNKDDLHNVMSVVEALKEEEDARRSANRPIRG